MTHLNDLLLILWHKSLSCILRETTLDHLLNSQRLHTEKVENHVVRQPELRLEFGRRPEDHEVQNTLLLPIHGPRSALRTIHSVRSTHLRQLVASDNDDRSGGVETTTAGATSHLCVFSWENLSEAASIMLPDVGEDYTFSGHVDTL